MQENKIIQLSDREHVLLRPNMYIGSVQYTDTNGFLFNNETQKFEYVKYSYIPGVIKIINEILDNAIDEYIRTNGTFANKIDITITQNSVKISDTGRGVPIHKIDGQNISQLELAFTHAKTGSNFNDEGRETLGTNGVGSFCSAVFAKYFKVTSQTATHKGVLICEDNLTKKSCEITEHSSNKTGTIVEFIPDFKRFNIEKFDELHINLIYQRCIHLSACHPKIKFTFNDKVLKFNNIETYLTSFSDIYCCVDTDKYAIAVMPNATDDFIFSSYVNGLNLCNGGNHIDVINNEIISRLRENKIFKKYKITPGDIRNKIQLVVIMRNFPKMEFDSQSKEKLTNSPSSIKQYLCDVDWDDLAKSIAKNEAITDPILINYKLKEELKNRLALKNMEKTDTKEIRCEKYFPSTGEKTYLAICEGDCLQEDELIFNVNENRNIKIKDIQLGDLVLTHNQNISRIIHKTTAIKDCVRIKTKSGKEIKCSKLHRFYVYDTCTNTFKFKRICNINIKTDKLLMNNLINNFYFNDIQIKNITNNEYDMFIHGENFEIYSSKTHKFIIFEQNNSRFILKEAQNIDIKNDLMVLYKKSPSNIDK